MNPRPPYGTWTVLGIYLILFVHFDLASRNPANLIAAGSAAPILVACGEPWRLLSAAFVHIGLLHLGFNGYFLYSVGPMLESYLGTTKFLILYIVAGIGGNTAAMLLYSPYGGMVAGGSTSLFGMLGALVAILIRRRRSLSELASDAALKQIGGLIVINLLIGFMVPQISNTGHIGGLITGFGLVVLGFELPALGGHARRVALGPAIAGGALFVAITLLVIFPVHRNWFLMRAWWRATPARAAALEPALVKRFSLPERQFLILMEGIKRTREGKPAVPRAVTEFRDAHEHAPGITPFGFSVDSLDQFLAAEKRGDPNPGRFLPDDPWRH